MDPFSLIAGAVGSVVDVIGGGPQARAAQAASQAEVARQAVEAEKAKTEQIKVIATYGIGGLALAFGGFIAYQAVTA
jgi:hypothetical protein